MPLRSVLLAASIGLALAACEPAPTPDTDPHLQPLPPVASGGNAFQVRVTLSEAAAAALEAEPVVVAVEYFGYPSVSAQQRQLPGAEEPRLSLARHEATVDAEGVATFPDIALDAERVQMIEQALPQVLVQAYPAEDDAEGGLLDCGSFQGELSAAARDGVDIDCKLIAE